MNFPIKVNACTFHSPISQYVQTLMSFLQRTAFVIQIIDTTFGYFFLIQYILPANRKKQGC